MKDISVATSLYVYIYMCVCVCVFVCISIKYKIELNIKKRHTSLHLITCRLHFCGIKFKFWRRYPIWFSVFAGFYFFFNITFYYERFAPDIGIMVRVFASGPGDLGSITGRVIPKTKKKKKMVLETTMFNTQHFKVRIKGKVEQSRERSSALPYILV